MFKGHYLKIKKSPSAFLPTVIKKQIHLQTNLQIQSRIHGYLDLACMLEKASMLNDTISKRVKNPLECF